MNEFIEIVKTYGPGGGLLGVTVFAVFMIYTGRLWPRKTVTDLLTQARDETQVWRSAYEKSEAARSEQGAQLAELLEQAKVTNQLLQGLPKRRPAAPRGD